MSYGKELILDIYDCDTDTFTPERIGTFMVDLCELIDMERVELHIWDERDRTEPHRQGISACQFIATSNIVIHAITQLRRVFLNCFSCKDFDATAAKEFTEQFFGGTVEWVQTVSRGYGAGGDAT